jgi:hypothetical protein
MNHKLNNLLFLQRFYDLSNKQMADILSIRLRQYSNIKNGNCQLDEQKMLLLAQHFEIEIKDLHFEDLQKITHKWFVNRGEGSKL